MAHDEQNACREGDVVEIVECRPLSARKRWRVNRVVRKAVTLETPAGAADPADQAGG
jgi:small subunit ribosomal protein S17